MAIQLKDANDAALFFAADGTGASAGDPVFPKTKIADMPGAIAEGSAIPSLLVAVAGEDGSGNAQAIATDTGGVVQCAIPAGVTVSGSGVGVGIEAGTNIIGSSRYAGFHEDLTRYLLSSADASSGVTFTGMSAPGASTIYVVVDMEISVDTNNLVTVRTATTNTIIWQHYMSANQPKQVTYQGLIKSPDANEAIQILTASAVNVRANCLVFTEAL